MTNNTKPPKYCKHVNCNKEFEYKRSDKVFCSSSCRSAFHQLESRRLYPELPIQTKEEPNNQFGLMGSPQANKVEKVSVPGIVNAAAGTAIVKGLGEILKHFGYKSKEMKYFEAIGNFLAKRQAILVSNQDKILKEIKQLKDNADVKDGK